MNLHYYFTYLIKIHSIIRQSQLFLPAIRFKRFKKLKKKLLRKRRLTNSIDQRTRFRMLRSQALLPFLRNSLYIGQISLFLPFWFSFTKQIFSYSFFHIESQRTQFVYFGTTICSPNYLFFRYFLKNTTFWLTLKEELYTYYH